MSEINEKKHFIKWKQRDEMNHLRSLGTHYEGGERADLRQAVGNPNTERGLLLWRIKCLEGYYGSIKHRSLDSRFEDYDRDSLGKACRDQLDEARVKLAVLEIKADGQVEDAP